MDATTRDFRLLLHQPDLSSIPRSEEIDNLVSILQEFERAENIGDQIPINHVNEVKKEKK